jgi:hypothetical protein
MRNLIMATAIAAALVLAAFAARAATDQPAAPGSPAAPVSPAAQKAPADQSDILYQCPMHPEVISTKPGKCPKCGMDLVPRTREQIMQAAHQAAGLPMPAGQAAGAPASRADMQALMLRERIMLTVRVDNADPAALLAMAEPLKLTKEQTAKLEAIGADARKKALAVLTKEQKATLDTIPAKPASLMELHDAAMRQQQGAQQLPAGHPAIPAAK